jgi:2'-hydroxyisoflavone reductase
MENPSKMNVLIIGGGVFVGRHMTDALLASGHTVTHFNRGISAAERADVETIKGDRNQDLDLVANRTWDAVIDTCAYVPGEVKISTEKLRDRVGRYVLISTLSVYEWDAIRSGVAVDESAPRQTLAPEADSTKMTPETYGPLKAACEDVVLDAFSSRSIVARCGFIVGPNDKSDRFTYWVTRSARDGRMLAPEGPATPLQFIDVRDLAAFIVHLLESQSHGVFNVTGQPGKVTFGTLFECSAQIAGTHPEIVWLDHDALARAGLQQSDIPLWIDEPAVMRTFHNLSVKRAIAAGLKLRPLEDTVRATLAWAQTRPPDYLMKAGLTSERESEALTTRSS